MSQSVGFCEEVERSIKCERFLNKSVAITC